MMTTGTGPSSASLVSSGSMPGAPLRASSLGYMTPFPALCMLSIFWK
eukprot:CCRYP_019029-RA/>CCRYP_019029-RA protein AED:0.45 eAED:0.45 QI:0/-1/0/1/-1/0/1/0/46